MDGWGLICCVLLQPPAAPPAPPAVELTIALRVSPQLPPRPALRYQLLREFRELEPGNPIHGFAKILSVQHEFLNSQENFERYTKWIEAPLGQLPAEARAHLERGPMAMLDRASRLATPKWGMIEELKRDGIGTLLSDVQSLRHLAGWNRIRCRLAIQEGRFAHVLDHAKSGFELARHLDHNQTLIGDLVGVAIARVQIDSMEELVAQPGAPNLFWAWAALPAPLIPLDRGLRGDAALGVYDFQYFLEPRRVWGENDLAELTEKLRTYPAYIDMPAKDVNTVHEWVREKLKDAEYLRNARQICIDAGLPKEFVERYPAPQVLFHILALKYQAARDDRLKYLRLPIHQIQAQLPVIDQPPPAAEGSVEEALGRAFGVGVQRTRVAQARLQQRIAMMQIVEALRWHAALHGEFPRSLDAFAEPLPADVMTNRPFEYECDGTTAHLRCAAARGFEAARGNRIHYEIHLRK